MPVSRFDPNHSWLEKQPSKIAAYIKHLEEAFGDNLKVVGILEFGSYAKGEAVSLSDIDTRVFVSSPNHYIWQEMSRFQKAQQQELKQRYQDFLKTWGNLPKREYDSGTFNKPLSEHISQKLGGNIEFGLIDQRYARYELENLDQFPSNEHHILFESNIIYDPQGFLGSTRRKLQGKTYPKLVDFYQERYLNHLPFEIYTHLKPEGFDKQKMLISTQIQWVKWAVRCLRDAVASRSYIDRGVYIYKKEDILSFYQQSLPEDFLFVKELYDWKTEEKVRLKIAKDFAKNPIKYFTLFKAKMPQLEKVVATVKDISLKS